MSRRSQRWFVLLSAFTAFAISTFGEPQDIQVIQVPIVTEARIQFFRLPWPFTRFVTRKVLQDNQGFLWLSAADGLRRYDGYGFLRVPGDSEGRNASGFITSESLIKDRSGVLWFGTEDFLDRYNPATGEFKRYRTVGEGTCRSIGLHQISEDREGLLWLATNESLMRLDPATERLDCYSHREDNDATIASNLVLSTIESRDGTLWVATSEALEAFDRRTGKVMRRISFKTGSGAHWSLAAFPANLYEGRAGVIWTGLSSGGDLAAVDPKTGRITVYNFRAPESQKIAPSGVLSILEDQEGALWLGSNGLGLLKLEPDRKRVVWYESNPDDPNGLGGDLVVGLFRDREGSFWANTNAGDVYRFDARPPVFRSYRHQPLNQNSLIDDSVISAYEDSRGFLWVGTEHGLNRIDRRKGDVKRYVGGDFAVGVRSIAEDPGGYLWFGLRGNGLMRFDPRTGISRTYSYSKFDPKSLSNGYVGALLVDRNGTLWAATDYGINRYDEKTGQFQRFSPPGKSLTRYHSIAEDQGGALWLASSEFSLDRFDPRTGEFTEYGHNPDDERSLSHYRVYSVYADHAGTIWAATFRGLDRFSPADRSFTHYDARNGLPANTVLGILDDEDGYIWVTTPDGLSRFDPRTETCRTYHASDGLPTDLFSVLVAAAKSPSGEMFFGSYSGLVAFFPKQVTDDRFVPPLVLTNLRLFGEPVPIGKGPLKKPIWSLSSLELSQRSIFSFDFSALSYVDPARTQYRYRLDGLESKWNETDSSRRIAAYTTLPAGPYTLQVQARTSRGDWTESGGVRLNIRILPLWYATWWFRSLGALAFLALVWAYYRVRLHQLAQEFKAQMEGRFDERLRVARDLHDTLLQSFQGLIPVFQTARNLLPGQSDRAAEVLDEGLHDAAEAIVEGRNAIQNLRAKPSMDRDLGFLLNAAGQELAQSPETEGSAPAFRVVVEGSRLPLAPLLQDEIYRIGREMLRNAFRHAHASRIEAEIRYDRGTFRLRIRDNGKGIDSSVLKEGARTGHWGLPGMHERAKRMGGRLKIWSEPGAGTEAELTVPARIAYHGGGDRLSGIQSFPLT
jgi:signal transduction histidine kinase/ligand-binding sensor domain-containing protein